MNFKWDFLLSKFRNLGGIAENICQKEGNNGRGIFPVDNKLKSKIFTPSSLIIKKRDIHLQDGKVRIKEKKFTAKIQEIFSITIKIISHGEAEAKNQLRVLRIH